MKINKLDASRLRNDEHLQFHTHFSKLVAKHGADALKITAQYETYLVLLHTLDEGIKKINKSALTAKIQAADKARDEIWSGMVATNSGALKHFDPQVRDAAQNLKILFGTYGNIAKKPLIEQTSAVHNVLQDLQGKYAPDVAKVGLGQWVEELLARNDAFDRLIVERFDEKTLKCDVAVKEARAALDTAYHVITERIAAYALLEGAAAYEQFIRSLNTIVEEYVSILSRHSSKKKSES